VPHVLGRQEAKSVGVARVQRIAIRQSLGQPKEARTLAVASLTVIAPGEGHDVRDEVVGSSLGGLFQGVTASSKRR